MLFYSTSRTNSLMYNMMEICGMIFFVNKEGFSVKSYGISSVEVMFQASRSGSLNSFQL